jgi:hypothetical protein
MEDFDDGVPSSKSSYPCARTSPAIEPGTGTRGRLDRRKVRLAAAGVQRVGPP